MKLNVKIYGALCSTRIFQVNGKNASSDEFGEQDDHDRAGAEDYACGDMRFERIPATEEVLNKYGITLAEYSEVCDQLEEGLSFGSCGWCV